MRIRAMSVFEGVVYHCWPVDRTDPGRPLLEVEALLRPGDADATAGPLLVSVADYIAMVGDLEVARATLSELAAEGRIVQHLTADHIAFPTWSRVALDDTEEVAPEHDPAHDAADGAGRPTLRLVTDDERPDDPDPSS